MLQLLDEQHEPIDLSRTRAERRSITLMQSLEVIALGLMLLVLRQDHRLQRCRIQGIQIRQVEGWEHERSIPYNRRGLIEQKPHEYRRKHSNTHHLFCGPKRRSPVDTFEQHRQLRTAQRYRTIRCLRPHEAPSLKPLRQQAKPVTIEPEHLHDVASAPAKDEDVTGQWLLLEHRLHLGTQTVEAAPHVRHTSRNPDPGPRRQSNHERRLLSTARTTDGSTSPSSLIRTLPGSSMWIAPLRSTVTCSG